MTISNRHHHLEKLHLIPHYLSISLRTPPLAIFLQFHFRFKFLNRFFFFYNQRISRRKIEINPSSKGLAGQEYKMIMVCFVHFGKCFSFYADLKTKYTSTRSDCCTNSTLFKIHCFLVKFLRPVH